MAVLLFLICFNVKALDINSKNAVLINTNTGSVVYEKAKDEKVSVASLQKILTTIVAIEHIDNLDEKIVIDRSKIASIPYDVYVIGLKDGEELTYYDLLEATILKSAGDAAKYLALSVSGSEEEFAKLVNDKAKEIGLKNTVYKDPIGLERDGQYSTAYDVALALEYSLKNEDFKKVFTSEKYKTTDNEFDFAGPVATTKAIDADYIKGAKTGFTSKAGLCLASYIKNNKEEFILVTLNADKDSKTGHFYDQKTIMDYYIKNYELKKVIKKNDVITDLKTSFGEEIQIKSDENVYAYVNKNNELNYKYDGITKVNTNNKNGDILGKYYVYSGDDVIYEKDVYLNKKVSFYIPPKIRYILIGVLSILVIVFIIRRKKKI